MASAPLQIPGSALSYRSAADALGAADQFERTADRLARVLAAGEESNADQQGIDALRDLAERIRLVARSEGGVV